MEITSTKTVTTTTSANKAYDDLPVLAYLNMGIRVQSENNPESSYQLNPFLGTEIKEVPRKKSLSKQEKALFAAIVQKIQGLEKGKSHKINLEVEVYVMPDSDDQPELETDQFLAVL